MLQSQVMDVPITQFRQRLFDFINQALEGKDVWVSHKGRRLRLVPEHGDSKLSRITPMNIVAPGADLEDSSWKAEMMSEWERDWDRQFGMVAKPGGTGPKSARAKVSGRGESPGRARARRIRRKP
jgi:hypothetical protein